MADKNLTLNMTGDTEPVWFTPTLRYLSMKREYLGEFLDREKWGQFGTKQQIVAVSNLLDYLANTRSLGDQYPYLLNDVTVNNKNLIMQRFLPLPDKLYEQLLLAVVEGAEAKCHSIWDQPSSETLDICEKFLLKMNVVY